MSTRSMSVRTFLLALLVTLTMGVQGASAQRQRALAKATVPFGFQYGTHAFPSGTYQIAMVSENIMMVRGQHQTGMNVVLRGEAENNGANGRLVFHREGDTYVLRDVWVPSLSVHVTCLKAKQHGQREVAEAKAAGPDREVAVSEVPR